MQKDLIYINGASKALIDASGANITTSSRYPTIERGQWSVLCVTFVNVIEDDIGAVSLSPIDMSGYTYVLVADNDFNDDNTLALKSIQSTVPFNETDPESNRINIEGDWIDGSTADPTKGQISIRLFSDTEKFAEILGAKATLSSGLYTNIKQYSSGFATPSSVAWFPFVAKNTIRDWGTVQENPPTGESVATFVSAYVSRPTELQFSADGTSWHTTQTATDIYYRQRLDAANIPWSPAIKLPTAKEPVKGVDYWTAEDQLAIKNEMLNQGW